MGTGAGQIIEDADFAEISQASSDKPIGRVLASGTQSMAHNTYTAIAMATEEIDSHSFHSTSVNTSRVTPTIPGYYRFFGSVAFGGRADYVFTEVTLRQTGGTPVAPSNRDKPDLVNTTLMAMVSALFECDGVSDYIEVVGRHTNGAAAAQVTAQSVHLTSCLEWEYVRGLD